MRPSESQISLGIYPVWSESSLCAQWVAKGPGFLQADSEDSDQTGRMPRLTWVFAGRTTTLLVLTWGGSYIDNLGKALVAAKFRFGYLQYTRSLFVQIKWFLLCQIPPFGIKHIFTKIFCWHGVYRSYQWRIFNSSQWNPKILLSALKTYV